MLSRKSKETCEIQEKTIVFRYSDEKAVIKFERVERIGYEWDFGLGFSATLVFYLDSDEKISFNGHILDEVNVIRKMGKVFPGFMDEIDLKKFLDKAEMYGWELIWSRNKSVKLP